jgi:hypothetical protein
MGGGGGPMFEALLGDLPNSTLGGSNNPFTDKFGTIWTDSPEEVILPDEVVVEAGPNSEPSAYVGGDDEGPQGATWEGGSSGGGGGASSTAAGGSGALGQRGSGSGSSNSAKQGLRLRGGY